MSRKNSYFIVILCTICCISIMLYYYFICSKDIDAFNSTNVNNKKSIVQVSTLVKENNMNIKSDESSNNDKNNREIEKNEPILNNIESSNRDNESNNKDDRSINRIEDINELEEIIERELRDNVEEKKIDKYDNVEKNRERELLDNKTVSVFKINKNTILKKISFKDKMKLLKIAVNLPKNEYKTLIKHIKRGDELGAAKDIFIILENNLSKEEFNDIKIIFDPYININMIEKSIV